MKPVNNKIIVSVNMKQKDTMTFAGVTVKTAMIYEVNYREKSPVVACVVEGNKVVKPGQLLLCHHNSFYHPSPYFLQDDKFAIPFGKTIFAIIQKDGTLRPLCGNIISERILVPTLLPVPVEDRKTYIDRVRVIDSSNARYKPGQTIFHRKNAGYDIVYVFNGVMKRVTKVHDEMVCGYVK